MKIVSPDNLETTNDIFIKNFTEFKKSFIDTIKSTTKDSVDSLNALKQEHLVYLTTIKTETE